jgi:hypothetical protein
MPVTQLLYPSCDVPQEKSSASFSSLWLVLKADPGAANAGPAICPGGLDIVFPQ